MRNYLIILGKRRVQKATKKLCNMLFDKRDNYELIEIANAPFLMGSSEALSCVRKTKENSKYNKILINFMSKLNL